MNDPSTRARIAAYLRLAGMETLVGREADVERAVRDLVEAMGAAGPEIEAASLYTYPVPMLTEDGTCSVVNELAPVPYDLTGILGGRSETTSRRLALLRRLVLRVQETTGSDWVGVYQRRTSVHGQEVLVKLAYVGRASRAEFPLTRAFAERSTNAAVGLTGRASVIDDVGKHVEAGGGFYVCDEGVQSEACVPILEGFPQPEHPSSRGVIGIVDAEAKPRRFFEAERLRVLAALAIVAPALMP